MHAVVLVRLICVLVVFKTELTLLLYSYGFVMELFSSMWTLNITPGV
jgi:hypothetical protein